MILTSKGWETIMYLSGRSSGYWGKPARRGKYVLTWGGLGIDSVSIRQEVSRGHSSQVQRAVKRRLKVSQTDEGLNVL